jgi:hypothetical protein
MWELAQRPKSKKENENALVMLVILPITTVNTGKEIPQRITHRHLFEIHRMKQHGNGNVSGTVLAMRSATSVCSSLLRNCAT